jgi:hypothetical protein
MEKNKTVSVKPQLTIVDYTNKFENPTNLEFPTSKQVSERLNKSDEEFKKKLLTVKPSRNPIPDLGKEIPEDQLVTVDIQEITDYVTGREDIKKFFKQITND